MKFSEHWLREWVNPDISNQVLVDQLTMAGLEVDSTEAAAAPFNGVVIGEVLSVSAHPNADKLNICTVNVGQSDTLTIVCGAKNVSVGIKVAVATVGAKLPEITITEAEVRGVASSGMICSSAELGLSEESDGILHLPADAPIGVDFWHFALLDDTIIEIDLTPNRGDCLSIAGIARDIGVINRTQVNAQPVTDIKASIDETFPLELIDAEGCPRYCGRLVKNINVSVSTPWWMQEKLRRCGIRSISPVVDITNYVMLEYGQPMHAFDAETLQGKVVVRQSQPGETITLLDGQSVTLNRPVLVIADDKEAIAMAGIMGGERTAVGEHTQHVFLEAAHFAPLAIAGKGRAYGLQTDSSYRFERGVDPELPRKAIERATELLVSIAGGEAGLVQEVCSEANLPTAKRIDLQTTQIARVLGVEMAPEDVEDIFKRLGFHVELKDNVFEVIVPTYRFDISAEEDLIEELARIYGYDQIPNNPVKVGNQLCEDSESILKTSKVKQLCLGLGYSEAITYSFIEPKWQQYFDPDSQPLTLSNPISTEMSVMRTSIWPGLIKATVNNLNRQQSRVRLFETGLCFTTENGEIIQEPMCAGVAVGSRFPQQWGVVEEPMDYFDIKGDIEALLKLTGNFDDFEFKPTNFSVLHPGQAANIYRFEEFIGRVGKLHPKLRQELQINTDVYLFEVKLKALSPVAIPKFAKLSKYPAIRRDIAILVDEAVTATQIQSVCKAISSDLLKQVIIFDVYQGAGIDDKKKSVALGLILQHPSRTLVDNDANEAVDAVVGALQAQLNAVLRG